MDDRTVAQRRADREDEQQQRLKVGQAACDLAIAASRLADADTRLASLGRELRETDAARGMPDDKDAERALVATRTVAVAYTEMRAAERAYEELTGSGNPLR